MIEIGVDTCSMSPAVAEHSQFDAFSAALGPTSSPSSSGSRPRARLAGSIAARARAPKGLAEGSVAARARAPKGLAEEKCRNKRWRVTSAETSFLETVFLRTPKPSRATIEHTASTFGVQPRQVQVWFQNRRQRWRKESSAEPSLVGKISPTQNDTILDWDVRGLLEQLPSEAADGNDGSSPLGASGSTNFNVDESVARSSPDDSGEDHSAAEPGDDGSPSLWWALNRPAELDHGMGHSAFSSNGGTDEEDVAFLQELAFVLDICPSEAELAALA